MPVEDGADNPLVQDEAGADLVLGEDSDVGGEHAEVGVGAGHIVSIGVIAVGEAEVVRYSSVEPSLFDNLIIPQ